MKSAALPARDGEEDAVYEMMKLVYDELPYPFRCGSFFVVYAAFLRKSVKVLYSASKIQ